jgi:hypothetical protein
MPMKRLRKVMVLVAGMLWVLALFCLLQAPTFGQQTFGGWQQLPGDGTTRVSDTATVYGNNLYLFGIGMNDHAHYLNTFNGAQWSGWSPVPGGGTTLVSDTATVYGNKLYLFGIGIQDHQHYVNTRM